MSRVAGVVVAVRDGRAWVACESLAVACGACSQGRSCSSGWSQSRSSAPLEVQAELEGRVLVAGERLELDADDGQLLRAALVLYLPPLTGLLLGPALLRWWGFDAGWAPLAAAGAGLALGVLAARLWSRNGVAGLSLRRVGST